MSKPRRNTASLPRDDTLFAVKQRKPDPHEFVLDTIAPLSPRTHSMFGCLAIYVEDNSGRNGPTTLAAMREIP